MTATSGDSSSGLAARPDSHFHHYKNPPATEKKLAGSEWDIDIRPAGGSQRTRLPERGLGRGRGGGIRRRRRGHVVVVELGRAGGAVPGAGLGRLLRLVLQLLPAGPPQLPAQEVSTVLPLALVPLLISWAGSGFELPCSCLELGPLN